MPISTPSLAIALTIFICFVTIPVYTINGFMQFFNRKRKASSQTQQAEMVSSRKMIIQESRLLDLPDEILINIIGFLDVDSLLHARMTSMHLKEHAEPYIFENFQISRGKKSDRLAELMNSDTRRAIYLKSVLVSTKHEDSQGLERFPDYLRQMRNLRNVILETPDCNSKSPAERIRWVRLQQQYELIFQQSSIAIPKQDRLLPILEKCTMHFVDDTVSLYPLTKYSSIFLHPTLKSLTLSCACTDTSRNILKDYRQYKRTTALEHIHFEECDFDPDALEILLKIPKELKSLKMSEGVRYDDEFGNRHSRLHGNLNPGLLSRALSRSVADSLQSLSLSLGFRRARGQSINYPGRHLDLTSMLGLKRLEVSMTTLGLIVTRPDCDHEQYRRLPPTLETIRVFTIPLLILRGKPPVPFQKCVIEDKAKHGLPNLRHMIHSYEYQAPRGRSSFGMLQHRGEDTITRIIKESRKNVININDRHYPIYKRSDVRVTIEVEVTPPGFIPPYLHNEEKPGKEIMWDSDTPTYAALRYEISARDKARQATLDSHRSTSGGVEFQLPHDSDEEEEVGEEENALAIMNLAPQAQELFELLIMQPGQPFQW